MGIRRPQTLQTRGRHHVHDQTSIAQIVGKQPNGETCLEAHGRDREAAALHRQTGMPARLGVDSWLDRCRLPTADLQIKEPGQVLLPMDLP